MTNRNLSGRQFPVRHLAEDEVSGGIRNLYEDFGDGGAGGVVEDPWEGAPEREWPATGLLHSAQDTLDEPTVNKYAQMEETPPIDVMRVEGKNWLVDGHHRLEAARRTGRPVRARFQDTSRFDDLYSERRSRGN